MTARWLLLLVTILFAFDANACRDRSQRRAFQHSHPCPATGKTYGACPGYVVDHVVPLCKHGADRPSNMQWQTKADAAIKDKCECSPRGCPL